MTDASSPSRPLFPLGKVVSTPGALRALAESGQSPQEFLARHERGDWGDLETSDRCENADSLVWPHRRILSAYRLKNDETIWIITEADRSSTCILLPDEY